ncbi:hypothetical protein GCM10010129_83770 [Streptomyces fumigatiscleroticus]|nr:hypothetical protein GCM10010129_83770 [Streptomyces fumigatiscleroticus]
MSLVTEVTNVESVSPYMTLNPSFPKMQDETVRHHLPHNVTAAAHVGLYKGEFSYPRAPYILLARTFSALP